MLTPSEWNATFGQQPTGMKSLLLRFAFFSCALIVAGVVRSQELISQERWPDGSLRSTCYSEGDRTHFITYHENGQVKEIGCFNKGRRDGIWKQYSDTGALVARAGFKNGERQGSWEFRTEKGGPMGRLFYSNGSLLRSEAFDEQGALRAQRSY